MAADSIVRELSKALGGSGGGTKDFAQGGGPKAIDGSVAKEMVAKSVAGMLGN